MDVMFRRLMISLPVLLAAFGGPTMAMTISSPVFNDGGEIPSRFTCEADDISPPLVFAGIPAGAKSLVLIVDDPDAPDPAAPKMTWVHWLVFNLPPDTGGLPEALEALPGGAEAGLNDWHRADYGGPCPPIGRHRYFFKLYALDARLTDLEQPNKPALLRAMQDHVLAEAQLMGTYQKQR